MSTLYLSLKGAPFEVMLAGEKRHEYRRPGGLIEKQLRKPRETDFQQVKFINGYGHYRPWFTAEFWGWDSLIKEESYTYSNGLYILLPVGTLCIHLGRVLDSGNLHLLKPAKPKKLLV